MPLSKEHKAEYNKSYYQRSKSGILNPIKIPGKEERLAEARVALAKALRPKTDAIQSKNNSVRGYKGGGRQNLRPCSLSFNEETRHIIPYKSGVRYKPGTEVILPSGEIITAPEVDAGGNEVPEYY